MTALTGTQKAPHFEYAVWDGTNDAEVLALVQSVNWWVDGVTGEVLPDGSLSVALYRPLTIQPGHAYVVGPLWGGEGYGQDGGPAPSVEVVNPNLFANKFLPTA